MKTLALLLALVGGAYAQTPEAAPIDPRWKVDPREAAVQDAADRTKRMQGLLPSADGGPWRAPAKDSDQIPAVHPQAPSEVSSSYLGGLVTVDGKPGGKKDVRADLSAAILPESPAGTLTIGGLKRLEPTPGLDTAGNNYLANRGKGPKAVAAVTLKITF